jgi:hypothetical protein
MRVWSRGKNIYLVHTAGNLVNSEGPHMHLFQGFSVPESWIRPSTTVQTRVDSEPHFAIILRELYT